MRIASCDHAVRMPPHETVREQAAIAFEQDHLAAADVSRARAFDVQQIAGLNRRRHAASVRTQSCRAEALDGLAHQRRSGSRSGVHEVLRTRLHWRTVGLIFPQASAVVSNTPSRTNAGLTYGFFA